MDEILEKVKRVIEEAEPEIEVSEIIRPEESPKLQSNRPNSSWAKVFP
jgi:hypothetical protein